MRYPIDLSISGTAPAYGSPSYLSLLLTGHLGPINVVCDLFNSSNVCERPSPQRYSISSELVSSPPDGEVFQNSGIGERASASPVCVYSPPFSIHPSHSSVASGSPAISLNSPSPYSSADENGLRIISFAPLNAET